MDRRGAWLAAVLLATAAGAATVAGHDDEAQAAPDDYEMRFRPTGPGFIALSARSLEHAFEVEQPVTLSAWAQWWRPYASVRYYITGPDGAALHRAFDVAAPDRIEDTVVLAPGAYEVRLHVFGAHELHDFAIGGRFSPA